MSRDRGPSPDSFGPHEAKAPKPGDNLPRGRADTVAVVDNGRNVSQLSHGLTGRYGTMASMPDTRQNADLRIRIPAH
jgi:hypothetical protein